MESTITSTNPFKKTAEVAPAEETQTAAVAPTQEFDPLATPFGSPDGDDDDFSFDLTNAQSQSLIPPQRYIAVLTDLIKGTSSSGNTMWTFTFQIVRNADGSTTPYQGRTLKKFCAITPAAMGIFTNAVEALGLGEAGKPMHFKKADALNRLCYINVATGEYNGQPQSNIGQINPYSPVGQKYTQI